jgi:queuine tRNA-ribosyltransferase
MPKNHFQQIGRLSAGGRSGILNTRRGPVNTPFFMPVATKGAVKGLEIDKVIATGAQVLLSNTYHLHLSRENK